MAQPEIDATKQYNVVMLQTISVGTTILLKGSSPQILGETLTQLIADNPTAIGSYMALT